MSPLSRQRGLHRIRVISLHWSTVWSPVQLHGNRFTDWKIWAVLYCTWKCLSYKESSQQLPSCHPYERLAFLQNVFAIILLLARKDVGKLFEDTLSSKIRKKEEADQWYIRLRLVCHVFVFTSFWRHLWPFTEHGIYLLNKDARQLTWNLFVKHHLRRPRGR